MRKKAYPVFLFFFFLSEALLPLRACRDSGLTNREPRAWGWERWESEEALGGGGDWLRKTATRKGCDRPTAVPRGQDRSRCTYRRLGLGPNLPGGNVKCPETLGKCSDAKHATSLMEQGNCQP